VWAQQYVPLVPRRAHCSLLNASSVASPAPLQASPTPMSSAAASSAEASSTAVADAA
jgi:hypothetical protein